MRAMAFELQFGLLGPMLVRRSDTVVHIPAGNQRVLLAALLLNQRCPMPPDEVAELLWAGAPPPSARATVHNYVKRLRQRLADADRLLITTQAAGYLLRIPDANLDISLFEEMTTRGHKALRSGQYPQAADELRAALALWRGSPLADVTCADLIARHAARLEELRTQVLEERIEADLHCGRQDQAVSELRVLIAADPLRERPRHMLMLALYLQGRQADALAAYQDARQALIDEIGLEPGAELRRLHQRILDGDPALIEEHTIDRADHEARPGGLGQPHPVVVPRQLPQQARGFTGRTRELRTLTELVGRPEDVTGSTIISMITGTAGVGKSALAVRWAHEVAGNFPDGQLFVNLRGYDPDQPMPAADALAGFLRALGVPGQHIPLDVDERAALYRSLLVGRRMLVVLDNARSADQVRPLLPSAPTCAVVVTSRDALAGLVARDGALRLELDLLPLHDAVSLMRALIGARVDAVPAAAQALAQRCSSLPLALRVAAEWVAARPGVPLADLADELAGQRRLDLLDAGGDPRTGVRAVFSWSYQHLDAVAARGFRLLSLHPGADLDLHACAAVAGVTLEQARHALDLLVRAHMILTAGPDRYGLHDLLRGFARELAAAQDAEDERRVALTQLFDHYLHAAATAMDTLYPSERHRRPRVPAPASPVPPLAEPAAARAWLDAEHANLAAVIAYTADHGWPGHAIALAATVFRYLENAGRYPEIVAISAHVRRAARGSGDHAAEARAVSDLAVIDLRQSRYQQAETNLRQALSLYQETGDGTGQARVLGNLGIVSFQQGRYAEADDRHEQALAQYRQVGDRFGEARTLNNLGLLDLRMGRYGRAADRLRQAEALSRQTSDWAITAQSLVNLALLDLRQARYEQASVNLAAARAINREANHAAITAEDLFCHGLIDLRQGRHEQAAARLGQALKLSRETGDLCGQAEALNGLGEVFLATSHFDCASARYRAALDLAAAIGDRYEQARARRGLADSHHAKGEPVHADREWRQALALFSALGTPEAVDVRACLAE